jgi:MoaA/NifB/PqqE/SkfB family radical SAM enzyme
MVAGQPRYVLRRERSGGFLFDRHSGTAERIGEGHYILLERAHNLGTGASGVRRFVSESFADERNAEAFLNDCVRRGILEEERASSLQIVDSPLPAERLPIECHSAPSRLYWRITDRGIREVAGAVREVTLAKARNLLKAVAEAGTFEIWIFGGEPTQHPFFPGIVAAAKEHGLFVTAETHATFDESMRNKMYHSLVDRFAVIVAGGAAMHDAFFGEGSYRKMVEFISRLAQRGEKLLTLVMPLGKSNIDKLEDAIGMAKAVRGEELFVMPAGGEERIPLQEFSERISGAMGLAEGLGVLISTPADLLDAKACEVTGCPAGVSEAYLDQDGKLRACRFCGAGEKPLGDILEIGYISLWLDSARLAAYRTDSPGCLAKEKLFG